METAEVEERSQRADALAARAVPSIWMHDSTAERGFAARDVGEHYRHHACAECPEALQADIAGPNTVFRIDLPQCSSPSTGYLKRLGSEKLPLGSGLVLNSHLFWESL